MKVKLHLEVDVVDNGSIFVQEDLDHGSKIVTKIFTRTLDMLQAPRVGERVAIENDKGMIAPRVTDVFWVLKGSSSPLVVVRLSMGRVLITLEGNILHTAWGWVEKNGAKSNSDLLSPGVTVLNDKSAIDTEISKSITRKKSRS